MPKFNFNYTVFARLPDASSFAREALVSSSVRSLALAALSHGFPAGTQVAILPTRFSELGVVRSDALVAYTRLGGLIAEAVYDDALLAASVGHCTLYYIGEGTKPRETTITLSTPILFQAPRDRETQPVNTKRSINIRRK